MTLFDKSRGGVIKKKKPYRGKKKQIHNPGQEEKRNEDKRNTKIIRFSRKILVLSHGLEYLT